MDALLALQYVLLELLPWSRMMKDFFIPKLMILTASGVTGARRAALLNGFRYKAENCSIFMWLCIYVFIQNSD